MPNVTDNLPLKNSTSEESHNIWQMVLGKNEMSFYVPTGFPRHTIFAQPLSNSGIINVELFSGEGGLLLQWFLL